MHLTDFYHRAVVLVIAIGDKYHILSSIANEVAVMLVVMLFLAVVMVSGQKLDAQLRLVNSSQLLRRIEDNYPRGDGTFKCNLDKDSQYL